MKKLSLSLLLLVCAPMAAQSEGIAIEPGLWETTMTRTNPMTGKDVTETRKECIEDKTIGIDSITEEMKGCTVTDKKQTATSLSFAMHCSDSGVSSNIKGEYTINGDSGNGSMDITMAMGGQEMNMAMSWVNKRLSDCE